MQKKILEWRLTRNNKPADLSVPLFVSEIVKFVIIFSCHHRLHRPTSPFVEKKST